MVRQRRRVDDFDLLGSMRKRIVELSIAVAEQGVGSQPIGHAMPQRTIRGSFRLFQ